MDAIPLTLEIVYQDEDLIAINKPHGLLVHRSRIAADADVFALQLVRDMINKRVYPVHRIDRKTSGVLLFAKSKETHAHISQLFSSHQVKKTYIALVRGFIEENGTIDYPLDDGKKTKEAITHYKILDRYEVPWPFGKFNTSRYSLLEITPLTGRYHQIRKHMAHIFHPIIGDRPHGCNKQNRLWKEKLEMTKMLLHAQKLSLQLDDSTSLNIEAEMSPTFSHVIELLNQERIFL